MLGTKVLEETESEFNGHLRVVRSLGLGIYIQSNGLTQSGGIIESIWRSTLRKIRASRFQIHDVLILGLGGGTVAKIIRKSWPDAKIMGIEIDPLMIGLGKKYLGLDEIDIDIKIQNAYNYLLIANRYDLIVVDLYNGDKFPKKFETKYYIQLMRRVLQSKGTIVFNRLYFDRKRPEAIKFGLRLQKIFRKVEYFYPEANLMLICYN